MAQTLEEVWKDIIGYEGLYKASNLGRIKSLERLVWNGHVWHTLKERILKQAKSSNGYYDNVKLSKDGVLKTYNVHRLIYEAHNGVIPDGLQVNHKDENGHNNKLSNLELLTPLENINYGTHNLKVRITKGTAITYNGIKYHSKKELSRYLQRSSWYINKLQKLGLVKQL